MEQKNKPVKRESPDLQTIGGRLVAERKAKNLSQSDLRVRTGVGKSTQINYESGQSSPDARYLAALYEIGLDVVYIITGDRSGDALTREQQSLLDAYQDATPELRRAAFAALLSPYLSVLRDAALIPGYYRYELKGEDDARYVAYREEEHRKEEMNAAATEGSTPKTP